jgi:hypothetical protein
MIKVLIVKQILLFINQTKINTVKKSAFDARPSVPFIALATADVYVTPSTLA